MEDTTSTIDNLLKDFDIKRASDKQKLQQNIQNTIKFNRKLIWSSSKLFLSIVTTPEELLEIYRLRSDIYTKLHYDNEFPNLIKGLSFDSYDEHSAILYTKINGKITGTCRVIFDSCEKLPIDKNYSLDYLRTQKQRLAEVSRLIIDHNTDGLSQEFKLLTRGVYLIISNNTIDNSVSVIKDDHFNLYNKFGGFAIEEHLHTYGNLENPFIITSWDTSKISNFFKRAFLNEKVAW